ncbi:MAG: hypothetical protein U9Q19_02605 [Pseudomonadota bacterium]|nr:hypothetical protein [Pseudomonadota bacterium]
MNTKRFNIRMAEIRVAQAPRLTWWKRLMRKMGATIPDPKMKYGSVFINSGTMILDEATDSDDSYEGTL